MAKEKPEKPLKWLGEWLIKNNKRKPLVTVSEQKDEKAKSEAAEKKAE